MKMINHPLTYIQTDFGYYRLDPLPTEYELEEFYKNHYFQESHAQYAKSYSREEIRWFRLDGRIANTIFRVSHAKEDYEFKLFDVGCGEGYFSAEMKSIGWDVRCCDFSKAGIAEHNPNLLASFESGNIFKILEETIAAGAVYDLVNLANVLEHVRDPVRLLTMLHQIISPTGMIRIVVPNDFSDLQMHLLASKRISNMYWLTAEHINYFNFSSLSKIMEASKLRIVRMLGDFPIENFLLNEHSNYKSDQTRGRAAHLARCEFDLFYSQQIDNYIKFLEAQAQLGIGRDVVVYITQL
jgi:2-polyprenyl-3-methyl-5-hydroxy-6-metoxy-1,4-benzoquinol methylase